MPLFVSCAQSRRNKMSDFRPTQATSQRPHLYLVSDNRAHQHTNGAFPQLLPKEAQKLQVSGCTVMFGAFPDVHVHCKSDAEENSADPLPRINPVTACVSLAVAPVFRLLRNLAAAYRSRQEQLRSRRWLSRMSDKELRDIGFQTRYHAESGSEWTQRATPRPDDLLHYNE
jgi:uncharacterized protein YjiS (DUF1127 family)